MESNHRKSYDQSSRDVRRELREKRIYGDLSELGDLSSDPMVIPKLSHISGIDNLWLYTTVLSNIRYRTTCGCIPQLSHISGIAYIG